MGDYPDYSVPVILTGWDGTQYRTLKVLETGELYAMLKALYGTTFKDIQCDGSGNLTLNVKAQDLAEIINRPKYGAAQRATADVYVTASAETVLISVSGKGIIYGGRVTLISATEPNLDDARLYVDGQRIADSHYSVMILNNLARLGCEVLSLTCYDTDSGRYTLGIAPGITFESSFSLSFWEYYGETPYVFGAVIYALV